VRPTSTPSSVMNALAGRGGMGQWYMPLVGMIVAVWPAGLVIRIACLPRTFWVETLHPSSTSSDRLMRVVARPGT